MRGEAAAEEAVDQRGHQCADNQGNCCQLRLSDSLHSLLVLQRMLRSPGYPPQQQAGPAYCPGYPPQQKGYAQQPAGYGRKLPDSAHEHALHQEASQKNCKVCQKPIGGTTAYVCHNCELVLCYNCGNAIFYGNKAKQIHPHTLALRVRNAWKCDLCKQHFKGTASFYCKGCDFDACSKCYVGF